METCASAESIPVIDLAALRGTIVDECDRGHIVAQVADACKNWGTFQLINHGVSQEVIEATRAQGSAVFALPLEVRVNATRPPGSLSGYGNGAVIAEAFNTAISSEAITFGYPHSDADAIATKLWPQASPEYFRTTIDKYNKASHEVALEILGLMVESLQETIRIPAQFHDYLTEHSGVLRINHYPRSEQPSQDIGLPPHIDDSLITIVHQGGEVAGLEVRKGGRWVSVQPRNDALVVIVAAVCQVLTNGVYKAVQHRASPNTQKVRLSLVYSAYPPATISITAAPEFVSATQPALYKPFTWSEYMSGRMSHILNPIDGLQPEPPCTESGNKSSSSG